jgi:hypothetical protein
MRGISTIPAPRRPRLLVPVADPLRAVRADRAVELLCVGDVAGRCVAPVVGAVPHTSQKPSTTVPVHPGSAQFILPFPAS